MIYDYESPTIDKMFTEWCTVRNKDKAVKEVEFRKSENRMGELLL